LAKTKSAKLVPAQTGIRVIYAIGIRETCARAGGYPWFKIGKIFRQFSIKSDDTSEQKSNFLKNF